jgi:hypothetical protein
MSGFAVDATRNGETETGVLVAHFNVPICVE